MKEGKDFKVFKEKILKKIGEKGSAFGVVNERGQSSST